MEIKRFNYTQFNKGITLVIGPRLIGKTTFCATFKPDLVFAYDLKDSDLYPNAIMSFNTYSFYPLVKRWESLNYDGPFRTIVIESENKWVNGTSGITELIDVASHMNVHLILNLLVEDPHTQAQWETFRQQTLFLHETQSRMDRWVFTPCVPKTWVHHFKRMRLYPHWKQIYIKMNDEKIFFIVDKSGQEEKIYCHSSTA